MTLTITIEQDESGACVATVAEVEGCHTQGASIRQALCRAAGRQG